jgi:hypothetical protein
VSDIYGDATNENAGAVQGRGGGSVYAMGMVPPCLVVVICVLPLNLEKVPF